MGYVLKYRAARPYQNYLRVTPPPPPSYVHLCRELNFTGQNEMEREKKKHTTSVSRFTTNYTVRIHTKQATLQFILAAC